MSASVGRPPFYLGIDLGGTNVKSGVVDDDGRSCSSVSLKTNAERGPEAGIATLSEAARMAVEASGLGWEAIRAVGLGSPGTMDIPGGLLLDPPNLPGWTNLPIRDLLAERLGKPTVLQNDGNAAAYGEYWAGAGKGLASLVLFTLGTGIGGGIVERGRIVEGRHSHGGECGHIVIQMEGGRQCACGGYGHLEAYASATALVHRAIEALGISDESTVLRRHLADGTLSARTINAASLEGDHLAALLMRETAHYLAVGAVCMMHTVDPDIILFAGGMSRAGPEFMDLIREGVKRMAFPAPASRTVIDYATLGGEAGYIGAAGCARLAFGSASAPDS